MLRRGGEQRFYFNTPTEQLNIGDCQAIYSLLCLDSFFVSAYIATIQKTLVRVIFYLYIFYHNHFRQSIHTKGFCKNETDWIIDTDATIEHSGRKHIECSVCGEILQTVDIPQLAAKDNSDEDGKAQLGAYSIILTDKNGKPVFNSEITIDIEDKISIRLPDSRTLDYADQTTITVFKTDTQKAVSGLNILVADKNGNNATGITDADGQLKIPNDKSSTGDDNGTIGKDDGKTKNTYVVTVTDKSNITIPSCEIYIGESNNVVVKLPVYQHCQL